MESSWRVQCLQQGEQLDEGVSTFYDDAKNEFPEEDSHHTFSANHRRLKELVPGSKYEDKDNLVMLMHGPGGSGKSTVIDLVIEYGQESCKHLGHPFDSILIDGKKVKIQAVFASQVDHILVQHCTDRIIPSEFKLQPQHKTFTANLPLPRELCRGKITRKGFQMKGMQLPLVSNTATTGHKLQGSTVEHPFCA